MIEYALLFGLGFLTASLVGLLLAPAIHRRIVKFTEDRILATVPVSPQELRAQKDMVRAEMAAAVSRTGHDLKVERQRAAQLSIANDQLSLEAGRLQGENADLNAEIEEFKVEASEMRSAVRNADIKLEQMSRQLSEQQTSERGKDNRIADLMHRVQRLTVEVDNLTIDVATRDTEAEGLRARINSLRDERERLREDIRLVTQRAKDAELRLAREENRAMRLEERLNTEVSGSVDKDTVIERRVSEIGRLKERLKSANAEAREAARALKAANLPAVQVTQRLKPSKPEPEPTGIDASEAAMEPAGEPEPVPVVVPETAAVPDAASEERPAPRILAAPSRFITEDMAAKLAEDVRGQATLIADRLSEQGDTGDDNAIREELADIAAKMIAIAGQREGGGSPIRAMIPAQPPHGQDGRLSLSERASKRIYQ